MARKKTRQSNEEVFAVEEFRAATQYVIANVMEGRGITQKALAAFLGCTAANICQILSEDGNPTVETLARIFFHLGDKPTFSSACFDSILGRDASLSDWLKVGLNATDRAEEEWQWDQAEGRVKSSRRPTRSAFRVMEVLEKAYDYDSGIAGNDCKFDRAA